MPDDFSTPSNLSNRKLAGLFLQYVVDGLRLDAPPEAKIRDP